jgi:hypothetical protein
MNKPLLAATIAAFIGIGIAGAVLADGGSPPVNESVYPKACYDAVGGNLVCDSAIPDASPVAEATPEPPTKSGIDTITELPSTGSGSTAK